MLFFSISLALVNIWGKNRNIGQLPVKESILIVKMFLGKRFFSGSYRGAGWGVGGGGRGWEKEGGEGRRGKRKGGGGKRRGRGREYEYE